MTSWKLGNDTMETKVHQNGYDYTGLLSRPREERAEGYFGSLDAVDLHGFGELPLSRKTLLFRLVDPSNHIGVQAEV